MRARAHPRFDRLVNAQRPPPPGTKNNARQVAFYLVHWAACGFYLIAKQGGFGPDTWVGANAAWLGGASASEMYVWSLYWSTVTWATLGYGDLHAIK